MFTRIQDTGDRLGEPEEVRNLSKKKLYKLISIRNVLPDEDARCMTRAYMIQIFRSQVYLVSREELLLFEARLQPDELLKSHSST